MDKHVFVGRALAASAGLATCQVDQRTSQAALYSLTGFIGIFQLDHTPPSDPRALCSASHDEETLASAQGYGYVRAACHCTGAAAADPNRPCRYATQLCDMASPHRCCSCCRDAVLHQHGCSATGAMPSCLDDCCSQRGKMVSCSDVTAEPRIGHIRRRCCKWCVFDFHLSFC